MGTVAGTVDVTSRSSPHAPAAIPVTAAARRRARATTPRSAAATRSSQPIVAEPNVASCRRGIGRPAATGDGGLVERRRRRADLPRDPDEDDIENREPDEPDRE